MILHDDWFEHQLTDRFTRYVRIGTASDRHGEGIPSTPGQWDLLRLLEKELGAAGITDTTLDGRGFLIARIRASQGAEDVPAVGFMAHVDTTEDEPGEGVEPILHRNYDGGILTLPKGKPIDPAVFPELAEHAGDTIITASGDTLLGADDKAGIAEIVTAMAWLIGSDGFRHGPVEAIFTPDEETGRGMDAFPLERIGSVYCYTLDGDVEGTIEAECFSAYGAEVTFQGSVIHPGTARGMLVNSVTMAGVFTSMLPRNESPEATDGRYGFYCPIECAGGMASSRLSIIIRDFEESEVRRRLDALASMARAVEAQFPGGKVSITEKKQYANMRETIAKDPRGLEYLEEAVRRVGLEPKRKSIRGGTDGSRLSEMGIPSPNIFTGGRNYHSRFEWASLSEMVSACKTIIHLVDLWANPPGR